MILTSPKNDWIQSLRRLHQAKGRRDQSAFLIEGTHLIQEALVTQWPLLGICYTPEWRDQHPGMFADRLEPLSSRVRLQAVSSTVLASLATTKTPDGIIGIGQRQTLKPIALETCQMAIAVETLQDPGNLGSLIRTAAAVGADALWVTADSVDPDHPKVLRASAGQWFRLPPQVVENMAAWVTLCQAHHIQVLAATVPQELDPKTWFWQYDLTQPTLFLLGNEGSGLSPGLMKQADSIIQIPMATAVESLNVGITGALLLFEAYRQRFQRLTEPHHQTLFKS